MKLFPAPFAKKKIESKLARWLNVRPPESYLAFLDASLFASRNEGYVITNRRLLQFEKEKIIHDWPLAAISAVSVESRASGEYYWWDLYLSTHHDRLKIEFSLEEWYSLAEFGTILDAATKKKWDIEKLGLAPRREQLHQATKSPLVLENLKKMLPLRPGEAYIAYRSQRFAAGTVEFVLTNQRVAEFDFTGIIWEMPIKDIQSYKYEKLFANMKLMPYEGKSRTIAVSNYYTYCAAASFIDEIQSDCLSVSPHQNSPKPPPLSSSKSLHYPLLFTMNSRGFMEGFQYEVTDAEGQVVFLGECRDPQTVLISEGDVLAVMIKERTAGQHYRFESPTGKRIGALKRVDQSKNGDLQICDGRGQKKGVVRKKIGLHSITKHLYVFEIEQQPILELVFQYQSPFRTAYEIKKRSDTRMAFERLCLYAVFGLRLLDPQMVKDPLRSHLSSARKKLMGKIVELMD